MDSTELKIEGMFKLGLITSEEKKRFIKSYSVGGPVGLRQDLNNYFEEQDNACSEESKQLEAELKSLIREDKNLLNKWRREVEKEAHKKSLKRIKNYEQLEKTKTRNLEKLEIEMAAADRKIDEIIAEASAKIEQEILKKIREKIV